MHQARRAGEGASLCLALRLEFLVRKHRCIGRFDHDVGMIELHVAGIAALAELVIGGGEFLRVLLLDGGLDGIERLSQRQIDQIADRHGVKFRYRLDDAGEGLAELGERIVGERPILRFAGEAELGVTRLNERVHQVAHAHHIGHGRIRRRRSRLLRRCMRGLPKADTASGDHGDGEYGDKPRAIYHDMNSPISARLHALCYTPMAPMIAPITTSTISQLPRSISSNLLSRPEKQKFTTMVVRMKPNHKNAPVMTPFLSVTSPGPRWPSTPASIQAMTRLPMKA